MRLIVLGIPHTVTSTEFNGCAFTQKVVKFLEMMQPHCEVIHIGHKDSEVPEGVTHYNVTDDNILRQIYGTDYVDNQSWKQTGFNQFDINDYAYTQFTKNAVEIINKIKQPNDILCLTFGYGHKAIADALPDMIAVETGIGYPAAFARYRVYESYAIMHAMYGAKSIANCDMDFYHRVIPNYFKEEDFTYSKDKEDYVLYLGRIGTNKGVDIAIQATELAGKRLVIAGQGSLRDVGYINTPDHVDLVGYADVNTRNTLMSKASALFIASRYLEPFAGVQIEAFLSGTPVISTDWGAFAEYNLPTTGFRCNTMQDFTNALNNTHTIDPAVCREHGLNFTLDKVAPQFMKYFQDVLNIHTGNGWYQL